MSDIFLSYAAEDLPRVLPLVRALERPRMVGVVGPRHFAGQNL